MKNLKLVIIISLLFGSVSAQQITISGTVTDASSGEALIAANVFNPVTLHGTTTNLYGFYSLKFNPGQVQMVISYIGYQNFSVNFTANKDTVINVALEPVLEIEEVTISSQSPREQVKSTQMGMVKLSPLTVEKLPALLGETDVIKTMQLMPGVQGGTEGTSGFYVRGGGPDQNLILLDGVPVYNVNHLFGFMSVFNSDAIKNVNLIKGGFPARYGGRLSSVLDIRMKEGNMHNIKGSGSIGIISSKLMLEGPIIKDKTSFMISGRRSYVDILSYPFQMAANYNMGSNGKTWFGYFLQDLNGKINHKINDKHHVYFSVYTGKDKFYLNDNYNSSSGFMNGGGEYTYSYKNKMGLQWGNFTSALRWNTIINNELFSNVTATVSKYKFQVFDDYTDKEYRFDSLIYEDDFYMEYYSQIVDYGIKADFDYMPGSKHYIRFGGGNTLHLFSPGVTVFQEQSLNMSEKVDTAYGNTNIPSNEFYLYVEDDFTITDRLQVNGGLHYSGFFVEDKYYHSLEPRISGRYMLTQDLSIKASYVKMQQYLHLLANSSMGLPTDLWVPATKRIKPQQAHQVAVGAAYALKNKYEFSLEGYYKKMTNLLEYAEGASYFELNMGDWQDLVTPGEGESYGMEFFVKKGTGKFTGWIGYTLSWSMRQFPEISFGNVFPYRYDSRHDLSIVATYKFNDRMDIGATWVYRTGYPFTLEDQKYHSPFDLFHMNDNRPFYYYQDEFTRNNEPVEYFENRNNYRFPDYHRLDIGLNRHKEKKRYNRTWSFGVYNAYGKQNPFFIYDDRMYNPETGEYITQLTQISILTFIPYIRWSIKF